MLQFAILYQNLGFHICFCYQFFFNQCFLPFSEDSNLLNDCFFQIFIFTQYSYNLVYSFLGQAQLGLASITTVCPVSQKTVLNLKKKIQEFQYGKLRGLERSNLWQIKDCAPSRKRKKIFNIFFKEFVFQKIFFIFFRCTHEVHT